MSNFVVSARKYRPVKFSEVIGQTHVTNVLKKALSSNKIAQAFLFTGPRGVGKTTCARILAKTLNCQDPSIDNEPCNTCSSCESFNQNASFNITELDAASHNGVDHIRNLIEQVRFQPQQGKYKIFIIDEVHMLSLGAFNAFLKTLEEPPPYAVFILATTEKHKIIPTILSRCQIFDFNRIKTKDITAYLKDVSKNEGLESEEEALNLIAQKADGALRDALSIFDRIASVSDKKISYDIVSENLNVLDYDYYFKIIDHFLLGDISSLLLTFNEITNKGFEPDIFLLGLSEHIRNLLVAKKVETHSLLEMSEALQKRYVEQAKNTSLSFLLNALKILNECDVNYKLAKNKKLHLELCLVKLVHIEHLVKQQLESKVELVEKKKAEPIVNIPYQEKAKEKETIKEPSAVVEKEDLKAGPTNAASPQKNSQEVKEEVKKDVNEVVKEEVKQPIQKEVKPSSENEKQVPLTKEKKDKKSASKIHVIPTLSLDDIEKEIAQEEIDKANEVKPDFNIENIKHAWFESADQVTSSSIRNTILNAELAIKDGKIVATVGSKLGEGQLREDFGLMTHLRDFFKDQTIKRVIEVDMEKLQVLNEKEKVLNPKELFDKFCGKNDNMSKLTKALDLSPDRV